MDKHILLLTVLALTLTALLMLLLKPRLRYRRGLKRLAEAYSARLTEETGNNREDEKNKPDTVSARALRNASEKLEDSLDGAGIKLNTGTLISLWTAAAVVLPLVMKAAGAGTFICVLTAAAAAAGPALWVKMKKRKRTEQFEEQLADVIDVLSSSMKAGYSFLQAIQTVSANCESPAADEFRTVFNEMQLGVPLSGSLARLAERMPGPDVRVFCTAVTIQSYVGGNLIEILGNISDTVRARIRLKKEIKAKTASGRISGIIVGALPVMLFAAIKAVNPGYVDAFISTSAGKAALAVSAVLVGIGALIIRKIVAIEY